MKPDHPLIMLFLTLFFRQDSPASGVMMSMLMALLRTIYLKGSRREIICEALLCGALTITAISISLYFGASENMTMSIGGIIGFIGVRKIWEYLTSYIQKKLLGK
ncbi:phage holin, lambda family [Rahnella sp. SL6]|uniref:phage holin, lambda family n=2 Tax=Rahnella TaxID=34037 RepID=UPI0012E0717D|nr:phage holin, lambda family [Rahnella aquatilis]MBU9810117.1 phage holin, lambda family [Rahnella perminowiae]